MNDKQDISKARAAIDALLEGKSDAFKVTVLELARQLEWDEEDPAFLIAIATHQLEALVKHYPTEMSAVMAKASEKLAADWQQIQSKLIAQTLESTKTAHQIDNRMHEVRQLLDGVLDKAKQQVQQEREEAVQVARNEQETIRIQAETQAGLLTTVYEEQSKELEAQAKKLAAHAIATAQANAKAQIQELNKSVKRKHYVEAAGLACACATALMVTSWTMGWVSRGRAEDNTVWADIERWNAEELQACVAAGTPTCNFHIEVPKD